MARTPQLPSTSDYLERLAKDDPRVIDEFLTWARHPSRTAKEIEQVHEFLEAAENRIRNSTSQLDRIPAALSILQFLQDESRRMGIHEHFLAETCGALCTYFQNRKIWDPAISFCEFLVSRGIPDEDGEGFHSRLDLLYRQRARHNSEN
jgi:hypothetical protein